MQYAFNHREPPHPPYIVTRHRGGIAASHSYQMQNKSMVVNEYQSYLCAINKIRYKIWPHKFPFYNHISSRFITVFSAESLCVCVCAFVTATPVILCTLSCTIGNQIGEKKLYNKKQFHSKINSRYEIECEKRGAKMWNCCVSIASNSTFNSVGNPSSSWAVSVWRIIFLFSAQTINLFHASCMKIRDRGFERGENGNVSA